MRALMRSRKAPPMSRFFPEMLNGMTCLRWSAPGPSQELSPACAGVNASCGAQNASGGARRCVLFAAALHRRRYPHRFTVFCDGSPRDLDARLAQPLHDGIVGEHVLRTFGIDQLLDAMAHGFRRVRLA